MANSNIVKMPKKFDYSASNEFNTAFHDALGQGANDAKAVILDCIQMDYIDSAGIGLLVMAHKKSQTNQAKISMINIKPNIREVLLLANLQKLIEFK